MGLFHLCVELMLRSSEISLLSPYVLSALAVLLYLLDIPEVTTTIDVHGESVVCTCTIRGSGSGLSLLLLLQGFIMLAYGIVL